eukprot:9251686-Prorocentrum_lima.AAC.1
MTSSLVGSEMCIRDRAKVRPIYRLGPMAQTSWGCGVSGVPVAMRARWRHQLARLCMTVGP